MALVSLLFTSDARVDTLELDAMLSHGHTSSATVTKHPVEEGADVSDHVIADGDAITLEGVISQNPVQGVSLPDIENRPANARQQFRNMVKVGKRVTISTRTIDYPDMIIESWGFVDNSQAGRDLRFTLTAVQIRVVGARETDAPRVPSVERGNARQNKGRRPAETPTAATEAKTISVGAQLFDAGVKAFKGN